MASLQYITEGIARKLYSWYCGIVQHPGSEEKYDREDVAVADTSPHYFLPYLFVDPKFLLRSTTTNADGIPIRHASDRREYINPLYAAYYGLVLLRDFDSAMHSALLNRIVAFLQDCCDFHESTALLTYSVELPRFHLHPPWISAITQGIAALFCLRLYRKSRSEDHREFAGKLLLALQVDYGAQRQNPWGETWFEEYPGTTASHVLNGHLFAVIAILEARQAGIPLGNLPSNHALIDGILRSYPRYLCGHRLRYSLLDYTFCNPHYVGLHALLFLHLARLTNQPAFLTIARELKAPTDWRQYFVSVGASPDQDPSSVFNWEMDG